jgi:pimeloyl-ACP methyl ester carboxylesterase
MILHVMGLGHPVITVEFRGVAMRLGKVYTADEVADAVVGILDKLNVKEACVVGHSYGEQLQLSVLQCRGWISSYHILLLDCDWGHLWC